MTKILQSLPLDASGRSVQGGVSKDDSSKVVPNQHDPDTGALIVGLDYVPATSVEVVILDTTDNISSSALGIVGSMSLLSIDAPSINGSGATYIVEILDVDDNSIYTSGNLTENTTTLIALSRRLIATDKIKITTSVSVGADKTFAVRIR